MADPVALVSTPYVVEIAYRSLLRSFRTIEPLIGALNRAPHSELVEESPASSA
jgi:hypothetical protein